MVKMERGIEIDGKHVCVRGQSHRKKEEYVSTDLKKQ